MEPILLHLGTQKGGPAAASASQDEESEKGLPRGDHLLYDAAKMANRASRKAIAPFPMNRM
jgi:hypothetical protein